MLMSFLRHMGIALSTSVSYVIAYFLLTYKLKKKHGIENIRKITTEAGIALLILDQVGFRTESITKDQRLK